MHDKTPSSLAINPFDESRVSEAVFLLSQWKRTGKKSRRGETQRRLSAERAEVQHRESLFSQQEPEVTLDTERDHVHRRWRQASFYQSLHALDVRRVD